MDALQTFLFEGKEVRTQLLNNEPWFVGKDVADTLDYKEPHKAIDRHVDEEDRTKHPILSNGGYQDTWLINESGLYSLILKSKMPDAKKFKRWVTSEVLPTIRKHGAYLTDSAIRKALMNPDTIIQLATTLKEEREQRFYLEQQIAELEPKISYLDQILSSKDTVTISQIAADYGMSGTAMNKILYQLGVQRKVGGQWILYNRHMRQGYTKSQTNEIYKSDGGVKVVMNTKWTQKGRLFLYNLLLEKNYYPEMDMDF